MIPPLFAGTQLITTTLYVGIPILSGRIGVHLAWMDATSAATVTLELSSWGPDEAPIDTAGTAAQWKDSGQVITGPAGSAVGSTFINLSNVNQMRARLKLVSTAACSWRIYQGVAS